MWGRMIRQRRYRRIPQKAYHPYPRDMWIEDQMYRHRGRRMHWTIYGPL